MIKLKKVYFSRNIIKKCHFLRMGRLYAWRLHKRYATLLLLVHRNVNFLGSNLKRPDLELSFFSCSSILKARNLNSFLATFTANAK